jgi:uridylate kinase
MQNNIVLKVGGSILYDSNLDVNLDILQKLKIWYSGAKQRYSKIVIVVGGGQLSRDMHKRIADSIGGEEYLHNIAMSVTQTNAALVQGFLEDSSMFLPKTLGDAYEYLMDGDSKNLVSGGLKSGWSTDFDAAVFADILDVDRVIKISNIDHVYTADPVKDNEAKPINDISWDEYFKLFNITNGDRHIPNSNIPIDTECAQFCDRKNISFYICGGQSIKIKQSLEQIMEDGSLIHP